MFANVSLLLRSCLIALLCAAAVVQAKPSTKERVRTLEAVVAQLQGELATLQRGQAQTQQTIQHTADQQLRMVSAQEEQRALAGRIEELEHRVSTLDANINTVLSELLKRVEMLESGQSSLQQSQSNLKQSQSSLSNKVKEATTPKPEPKEALVYNSAEELYDLGYSAVRSKQFDQAKEAFSTFISTYASHQLIGNAYYWLAESHYAKGDYTSAAGYFLEGYSKQPTGLKASDNLLKLALSLGAQGKKDEACVTLQKLDADFSSLTIAIKNRMEQAEAEYGCGANAG